MTRQPAGRPRDKRKGRRSPVPAPHIMRARAAPIGAASTTKTAESSTAPVTKTRTTNPMDFRYVNAELRRILFFIVGMVALVVALSFVLR